MPSADSFASTSAIKHIVDTLIEERATGFRRHPRLWSLVNAVCRQLLGYRRAVAMADAIAPLSGRGAMDYLSELLQLNIEISGLEHVPATGPCLVTPNHPAGIADGIAVYDVLKQVRDDICFVANRDAIRVCPRLSELIIPVEWRVEERTSQKTRETVKAINNAFQKGRLIVIFPSGRLAQPTLRGLKERPWQSTALNFANKQEAQVVPMHIKGQNSILYYIVWYINDEIKDMTLFRELLNKQGKKYRMTLGAPFHPARPAADETERLKQFVLHDLKRGVTRFKA